MVDKVLVNPAPTPSARELAIIALSGWTLILLLSISLGYNWSAIPAFQCLLQAGMVWWYVINATATRIHLNRAGIDSAPYDQLGWANRLTILRGALVALTAGFLFQTLPPEALAWLPGIFYTVAASIDRIDGYVARKSGQTSLLGLELDTVVDALGLAIAPLLAVWYGQIHWSYLLFSSAYYLFQWGIYRRKRKGLPVYSLPPNMLRRAWAGFQMGFIAVVLLPLFSPPVTVMAGFAFMIPVLIGFIIDWMIVSGRIDRRKPEIAMILARIEYVSQTGFLPALRGTLAIALIAGVRQPDTLLDYGILFTGGLILAGAGGRIAALVLIGLLGFYYQTHTVDFVAGMAVFVTIWILLLGTGHYSLWRRDEEWVNRYDGA